MMEAVVVNLRMILWGFYLVKLLVTRGVHFWLYRMYTCTRNQVNQLHEGSVARCTSITFFLGNMDHIHRWRYVHCACGVSCLEVSCLIRGRYERTPTAVALRAAYAG